MIRIGVIGAGHWGPNLIRNFDSDLRSTVAAVADHDPGRLAQVTERFHDVETHQDAGAVLADDSIDAVAIATPTATHFELTKTALLAGKHVLVEKPLATSSTEGAELCELAETQQKILMVGHVFLYNNAVREVRRRLEKQEIGKVFYLSAMRTNLGPVRLDVNAAWDLASHDVSIVNYWLDGTPLAVSASGGTWINSGIEDAVFATFRYPDETLLHIHASWLSPRKSRFVTVVGEKAMVTFDDMQLMEPIRIYDKGISEDRVDVPFVDTFASFRASVREGSVLIPNISAGEPLREQCVEFIRCIQEGETPLSDGRRGLDVVCAIEAAQLSMKEHGREVTIDR